ncbi:MAG: phosphatase PAP2 family protein [Acidobacteriota bacterium]|nr:phosphatase PAP2 family protein [Acidobacteriota bacterium]
MPAAKANRKLNISLREPVKAAPSPAARVATAAGKSLLRLVRSLGREQAAIWSFPRILWQGKYRLPTALFLLVTGLFFMIDPRDPSYFRNTHAFSAFNTVVSGEHAAVAMWAVMISALVIGLLRRDRYLTRTFLFAFEAILSSEIFTQVLKGIDRRLRPEDALNCRYFFQTWFQDKGAWYGGHGSFPSGHMIAAISIATVFAVRYRHHRWAPWTAYGAAAIIGFSRITLLSHFPSDVFAAAVLGYAIARYAVLQDAPQPALERVGSYARSEDARVEALS